MAIYRGIGSASSTSDQATIDAVTTKATEAATSATNAASSATAASTSATSAASSATTATSQASNASSSASAAASSAASAAASYDSFDDRYLGSKTSNPTVDNDGDALVTGALYFNSTAGEMRVYNGSSWVAAYASLGGALIASNNLSDLDSAATARTNLGLGTAATTASTDYATAAQGTLADSATQPGDNISTLTNDSGYITGYTVTQSDVTAHQAALSITESQISDLSHTTSLPFASITSTPTTLSGYGITDAATSAQGALADSALQSADIGVTVQGYDADTLKADVADTLTAPFRGSVTAENDGSFDLNAGNNFTCIPTSAIDLTFTNETAGQSGMILLTNTTPQTITVDADVHLSASDLTAINVAGTYLMSYYCPDGTNVYLSTTPALTEGS
jgi:hypothetical protein